MARGYANVKFQWNGKASTVIKNLGFGIEGKIRSKAN